MSESPRWPASTSHQPVIGDPEPGQLRPTYAWIAFAVAMIGAVPVLVLGTLLVLVRDVGCGMSQAGCHDPFWLWLVIGVVATVVVPIVAMALTRNARPMAVDLALSLSMFVPVIGWIAVLGETGQNRPQHRWSVSRRGRGRSRRSLPTTAGTRANRQRGYLPS